MATTLDMTVREFAALCVTNRLHFTASWILRAARKFDKTMPLVDLTKDHVLPVTATYGTVSLIRSVMQDMRDTAVAHEQWAMTPDASTSEANTSTTLAAIIRGWLTRLQEALSPPEEAQDDLDDFSNLAAVKEFFDTARDSRARHVTVEWETQGSDRGTLGLQNLKTLAFDPQQPSMLKFNGVLMVCPAKIIRLQYAGQDFPVITSWSITRA